MCLVTFMIATHTRVAELEKTLAACVAQDWPALEILVVDDASTDGTFEQVRRQFSQVNIVRREQNQGSVSARNNILSRAKGKYTIGLDDDSRFIDLDDCRRVVGGKFPPELLTKDVTSLGPSQKKGGAIL